MKCCKMSSYCVFKYVFTIITNSFNNSMIRRRIDSESCIDSFTSIMNQWENRIQRWKRIEYEWMSSLIKGRYWWRRVRGTSSKES